MAKFTLRHWAWFLVPLVIAAVAFSVRELLPDTFPYSGEVDAPIAEATDAQVPSISGTRERSETITTEGFEELKLDAPRPKDYQAPPRATATDEVPITVSFRIVTHQGNWAGGANGKLWVGAPQAQGLYQPAAISIEGGVSTGSIRLLPGYWGMYLSLDGCVEEGTLRFMLDPDEGTEQCLDIRRPPGGGTITGRAVDSKGDPFLLGTEVYWTAQGLFSSYDKVEHSGIIKVQEDGRFFVKWEGSATNLYFGIRRQLAESERIVRALRPRSRRLLDEGEVWDLGDVNAQDLPLLFSCKLLNPPKDSMFSTAKVVVRPPHTSTGDRNSIRLADIGLHYDLSRPFTFYGTLEYPLFQAELITAEGTWKSDQVITQGAVGVPLHFTRTARLSGKLLLPLPELYENARITLRSKEALTHYAQIEASNGAFYFSGVWPGEWMLHVSTALGWEKPQSIVVLVPTTHLDSQELPAIDLRDRWATRHVKVVDEEGGPITTPSATLFERSGCITTLNSGVHGEILIHYPKAREPRRVRIRAELHASKSFAFRKLPDTVVLSRGHWVAVEPGFDPQTYGDRLEWVFAIECDPDEASAPRYFPEVSLESDTPVTMGPFPSGELILSLYVRGYDRAGKRFRIEVPGGVRRTRSGTEAFTWPFPPEPILDLRRKLEKYN